MRILIISLNYAPEPTGIGLYSGELAQSLAEMGHDVSVIAANPHYPYWKLFGGYGRYGWTSASESGVRVTRCPIYIPKSASGGKRILHYFSFLVNALIPTLWRTITDPPDVVFCVAPSLISAPLALLAARLSGATSWLHVQDFEVEAGFATKHMSESGKIAKLARLFEAQMIGAFDRASSISREMCAKLVEKGRAADGVYELRNWADISRIHPQSSSGFRERWGIATEHVALYSGSIGRKQGIDLIVDVARKMRDRNDLTFVICGNGPTRGPMEAAAQGMDNIQFHDLQPIEDLNELLNLATIHLLPQRADAADLVLPSKMANMLASGRPIVAGVTTGHGLAREVEGAGLVCTPENADAMVDAIERLIDNPSSYRRYADEAADRARKRWSRAEIIGRFAHVLGDLIAAKDTSRLKNHGQRA
ncbi:WcaI family glycosyltransferase [Stakelama marina]|uniref:WcaI family glycosyltransferase n=1 Tax=Stakelama marina TaxID=2826939 RepID=A0A8T4ICB8_9SPHN|nr:WcaI family glycosyltransferase [Stakelama marina]MBR0552103.1 WcaI family glycosyltransferase [Stakelama marina]